MADRPRDDDWWLASDGKWYPPELRPGENAGADGTVPEGVPISISKALTNSLSVGLTLTSVLFVVASFFGLRVASDLRDGVGSGLDPSEPSTANEIAFGAWASFGLVAFFVTAVLVIAWTYTASRAIDARGAEGRAWRGGWTIGGWLIPVANLAIPKLVFNELEKAAQVPFDGAPIRDAWRDNTRTQIADLWWGLWVAGIVISQVSAFLGGGDGASDAEIATDITVTSVALLCVAAAGVALVLVTRRLATFSRR